jgi:hypothetical protein
VIQAFATNGADDPLDICALPWRAWRRQYLFDPHRPDLLNEVMAEDAVTIAQQIARRTVPRESLPELLSGPFCSRMCRDCEVNDTPTLVRKDEEHVEDLKSDSRDGKEVDGHKRLHMVVKEGSPGLRWRFPVSDEILAHARLPDIDAELQKLAVDSRRPPAWVLFAHAADQIANFAWDRRAARLAAADLPRPEEAKRLAVPGNDCFRLHDNERRTPTCPNAGQPNPQESVSCVQRRALPRRALENPDLMPECNILELQRSASFQGR